MKRADTPFSMFMTSTEREALRRLAELHERRNGETLRAILRAEARRLGVWPKDDQQPVDAPQLEAA